MKKLISLLSLCLLMVSLDAVAVDQAPKMINLQAILTDDGGNILYNRQEADITFSIVDATGKTLYAEKQHVPLVNGAMSVLVGRGNDVKTGQATGGIPLEALKPDSAKLLRFKLDDQSIPQEDLQLVSVPYSLYAQQAMTLASPLDTSGILDGTLQLADLSTDLIKYLDTQYGKGDGVTKLDAENVTFDAYAYIGGTNLQEALGSVNNQIRILNIQDAIIVSDIKSLQDDLATESQERKAADNALDDKIDTVTDGLSNHNHDGTYLRLSGADQMAGDLDMNGREVKNVPVGAVKKSVGAELFALDQRIKALESNDSSRSTVKAWARVNASSVSTSTCNADSNTGSMSGIVSSSNVKCIEKNPGDYSNSTDSFYKIQFQAPMASADSYVVTANSIGHVANGGSLDSAGGLDDFVVIYSMQQDHCVVRVREPDGNGSESSFNISIVGR